MKVTVSTHRMLATLAVGGALIVGGMTLGASAAEAARAGIETRPPGGFVKVSDALKNPAMAFIPGLGTLYVDPKTLPAGPFLGYDKAGRLVNVTYMLPSADLEKNKSWPNLGAAVKGLAVDHTEVHLSGAHPGVAERHVHVINWLISDAEKARRMGSYPHLH